jgi:hypothetical protein
MKRAAKNESLAFAVVVFCLLVASISLSLHLLLRAI